MKALVISGGGSKGAFAGGVAEYLMRDCKKEYDLFVGTSTGSLLAPMLAAGDLEVAKKVYTTIKQQDIFSICPFLFKKGKDGVTQVSINHWGIIQMFWRREKTFGDSRNLRALIEKTFPKKSFEKIRDSGKEVVVSVSNLTLEELEFKSSNDHEYEDFCDWIWASTSLVPFMSLVEKNGFDYGDGGFGSIIPIQEAINRGASTADVIVLYPAKQEKKNPPIRNAFNVWSRSYDFMFSQLVKDDQIIGNLAALAKKVALDFYFTPRLLTEQSFIFDPVQMKAWWSEGYQLFQTEKPVVYSLGPG